MKMLRSCASLIYMALGAGLGLILGAASFVVHPTLRYVAAGCTKMADGIDKLDRELAYKFNEDAQRAAELNSSLARESNGFRQASATKERTATDVRPDIMVAHG